MPHKYGVEKDLVKILTKLKGKSFLMTLVLTAMFLVGCSSNTDISLNDYVNINFEGYETHGHAYANFDVDAIVAKHAAELSEKDEWQGFSSPGEALREIIYNNVYGNLDQADGLSNGDTVTYEFTVDNEEYLEETYGLSFNYDTEEYEVEDLEEITTFDPFSDVKIVYSGFAPNGSASVDTSDTDLDSSLFLTDELSGLSNGDKITIRMNEDAVNRMMVEQGRAPSVKEKEYTVSGLAEYVTSLDEIPEETLEELKAQAKDVITTYTATWDNPEHHKGTTYQGSYLMYPKTPGATNDKNRMILVYEVNFNDSFMLNTYVEFYDLMKLEDGTVSFDISHYNTPTRFNNQFKRDDLYFVGYESRGQLFNDVVAKYVDQFSYETDLD